MLPTSSKSYNKRSHFVLKHPQCYAVLLLFILIGLFVTAALQFWPPNMSDHGDHGLSSSYNTESIKEVKLGKDSHRPKPADQSCLYHTCFDVYHCGYNDDSRISVYVYPTMRFVDERGILITLPISQEFSEIRQTVMDSIYYTRDPDKACLFLPPVDFLNQNNIRLVETARILAALPHWNEGINHLLFNMLPGSMPDYNTTLDVARDRALLAGGGFSTWTYRQTYDVAIPVFNPQITDMSQPEPKNYDELSWQLVSAQIGLHIEYRQELTAAASKDSRFLLLEECNDAENNKNISARCKGKIEYLYPQILQDSVFCLVVRGARLGQTALVDALMAGCIPVIVADSYVLPFSEVLDWKRAAVLVEEDNLASVMTVLNHISPEQAVEMRHQVAFLWRNYFSSMRSITLATLQIINDRVFPYVSRTYEDWNDPPDMVAVHNPLFLPLMPPRTDGFTAVILTYDRLESLFRVIQQVALAPSLTKVLVVWNNQAKTPPQASMWPKINKPLKVIQTRQNKLSNRFYPYDAIETEAILALDDDILMLTTDELEFGYQVWREFPDRLVGFPSRLHLWDNVTGTWKYESEWTSAISLVLTGAAFHHKYYSYVYTNMMPGHIKTWVDDHMNCEDLAMNFLISNATAKAPIKVTPRQKFKCPECQSLNMLSADLTHMVERSECITKFAGIYGMMPLKTVEFRADPVLYKDSAVSRKLQRFPDIGSL